MFGVDHGVTVLVSDVGWRMGGLCWAAVPAGSPGGSTP